MKKIKIGFFTIEFKNNKYIVENEKILIDKKTKKPYPNKKYVKKIFTDLGKAKLFAEVSTVNFKKELREYKEELPDTLYFIAFENIKTKKKFVKIGITAKKHVKDRFSKEFGYKDYKIIEIIKIHKIEKAILLETKLKNEISNNITIKKYKPENFSGYSECFEYDNKNEILKIFNNIIK